MNALFTTDRMQPGRNDVNIDTRDVVFAKRLSQVQERVKGTVELGRDIPAHLGGRPKMDNLFGEPFFVGAQLRNQSSVILGNRSADAERGRRESSKLVARRYFHHQVAG